MPIQRMDHIGVVVDDLAAATEFFVELGFVLQAEWSAEDPMVDKIIGLEGVRADVAMLQTPDGRGQLELSEFQSPSYEDDNAPAPANTPGLRPLSFEVDDLDAVLAGLRKHGGELVGEVAEYGGTYRLCYARGPAGIIVELAEKVS